jgi:hypothetical protein
MLATVVSPAMVRRLQRRLRQVLGASAQLVSVQVLAGQQGYAGLCTATGEVSHVRFSQDGRELQVSPRFRLQRWERRQAV